VKETQQFVWTQAELVQYVHYWILSTYRFQPSISLVFGRISKQHSKGADLCTRTTIQAQ